MTAVEQPTRFMIFATQRTGSNWLMGMLDAHSRIAAYDELLLCGAVDSGYWGRTDLEFFEPYFHRHARREHPLARAVWSVRYLDKLYAPRADADAVGMKLMYNQAWKHPWVWAYMARHRVRVLHLVRGNLLDIVLSGATVKARNQPHAWEGHAAVETPTVTLNPAWVVEHLKMLEFRVRFARHLLRAMPVAHIELTYETLTSDPSQLKGVFDFLSVHQPTETPESRFRKLNTSLRSELIENYADVERSLRGTRFARFLDD